MRFTRIKSGFSEHRRVPMLGRIRLGLKVKKIKQDGSTVEYPTETKHFVVTPEVEAVYGKEPTELDVMFLSDKEEDVFPQSLAWFGRSKGLKCTGNMEEAERLDETTGEWKPRTCPCEHYKSDENPKGECTEQGMLKPILPKVSMGGTYFIRTGSYHSCVDINSGLEYIRALIGRISMVPLKLRRVARETHNDGKKQTHYTLSLTLDANVEGINQLRHDTTRVLETAKLIQIEGPEQTNPHMDEADIVEVEAEDIANADDAELATIQSKLEEAKKAKTAPAEKKPEPPTQPVAPAQPATPPKQEAKPAATNQPAQAPTNGHKLISPGAWTDFLAYLDSHPDLNTLKQDWKAENQVDSVTGINAAGQQHLLNYMRKKVGKTFPY